MLRLKGFTLIELMITIGVLALLATAIYLALSGVRTKAGDDLRRAELNRLSQPLRAVGGSLDSYLTGLSPQGDLNVLLDELENRTGKKIFGQRPKDPSAPSGETGFGYIISGGDIVIYANLSDADAEVTLPYNAPTPGGGTGTLQGTGTWASGLNNTDKYYQVSNR
jgi:prepilin-type N-terminal cleavage/methylation domain-containing protein